MLYIAGGINIYCMNLYDAQIHIPLCTMLNISIDLFTCWNIVSPPAGCLYPRRWLSGWQDGWIPKKYYIILHVYIYDIIILICNNLDTPTDATLGTWIQKLLWISQVETHHFIFFTSHFSKWFCQGRCSYSYRSQSPAQPATIWSPLGWWHLGSFLNGGTD